MLKINGLEEGLEVFKTLGSEVRLRIVKLLSEKGAMNLNETDIRIGHYGDYSIQAPCGLAGRNSLIGEADMTKFP